MQGHVDLMEQDIRECANACDAYAKTKILHKVLRGARWDDVLKIFVRRFSKRRADIEFALAIHLGINIDIAHRKLDTLDSKSVHPLLPPLAALTLEVGLMPSTISFVRALLQTNENLLRLSRDEAGRRPSWRTRRY